MTTAIPERPQTGCEAPTQLGIPRFEAPAQGSAQVVVLAFESVQPGSLLEAVKMGSTLLGEISEQQRMASARVVHFSQLQQAFGSVLAHGLE